MGIPRLASHLQPYAIPVTLGCNDPGCKIHPDISSSVPFANQRFIIDGPSAAFFIYYKILAQKSHSLNALDAIPSYHELGNAIVVFFDELKTRGVEMYDSHGRGSWDAG